MIVQRNRGIRTLLVFCQCVLVSAVFWVLFVVLDQLGWGLQEFMSDYIAYWMVLLAAMVFEVVTRRTDELVGSVFDSSLVRRFPMVSRQVGFAIGALLVFIVFTRNSPHSRVFVASLSGLLYVVLLWSSARLPSWMARRLFRGDRVISTLVVGSSSRVAEMEGWLRLKQAYGLRIDGLLVTNPLDADSCFVPVLGSVDRFDELVTPLVKQVILLESTQPEQVRMLVKKCQSLGIRLLIVNNFAEQIDHPILCSVDEGVNLITLHEEPLENPYNRVMKRVLDYAISLTVVVLVMPWLCVLFWIIHRLQSPGPLFHRQRRSGLQNRTFEILKFRTMHDDHDDVNLQAAPGDVRIFPAGRLLRRLSLDEFPQFLNVLRGEMSVVGPRPHLIDHNRQFADLLEQYHVRAFIKPGITGLAQVRGFRGEARTRDDIARRLQSDLLYLENWSISLDVVVIARTMWQLIFPPRTAV